MCNEISAIRLPRTVVLVQEYVDLRRKEEGSLHTFGHTWSGIISFYCERPSLLPYLLPNIILYRTLVNIFGQMKMSADIVYLYIFESIPIQDPYKIL